jgi:hypothetical protein
MISADLLRRLRNDLRPWSAHGPTAQAVWADRPLISRRQRWAFGRAVAVQERQARSTEELAAKSGPTGEAAIMRVALSKALIEVGLLELTKQTIPGRCRRRR